MNKSNLIKEQCCNGTEVLMELNDIKLYELNNLMTEHPLLLGLKEVNNKFYGIVGYVGV